MPTFGQVLHPCQQCFRHDATEIFFSWFFLLWHSLDFWLRLVLGLYLDPVLLHVPLRRLCETGDIMIRLPLFMVLSGEVDVLGDLF